jgi:hypothetical protein
MSVKLPLALVNAGLLEVGALLLLTVLPVPLLEMQLRGNTDCSAPRSEVERAWILVLKPILNGWISSTRRRFYSAPGIGQRLARDNR